MPPSPCATSPPRLSWIEHCNVTMCHPFTTDKSSKRKAASESISLRSIVKSRLPSDPQLTSPSTQAMAWAIGLFSVKGKAWSTGFQLSRSHSGLLGRLDGGFASDSGSWTSTALNMMLEPCDERTVGPGDAWPDF